jgi:hypothetical protein
MTGFNQLENKERVIGGRESNADGRAVMKPVTSG